MPAIIIIADTISCSLLPHWEKTADAWFPQGMNGVVWSHTGSPVNHTWLPRPGRLLSPGTGSSSSPDPALRGFGGLCWLPILVLLAGHIVLPWSHFPEAKVFFFFWKE